VARRLQLAGGGTFPIVIPFAIAGGVVGILGAVTGGMAKYYVKKTLRATGDKVIAITALHNMNIAVNDAITDKLISDKEYSKALSIKSEYTKLRDSERKKEPYNEM
jgi:uncharacterized membrane protein